MFKKIFIIGDNIIGKSLLSVYENIVHIPTDKLHYNNLSNFNMNLHLFLDSSTPLVVINCIDGLNENVSLSDQKRNVSLSKILSSYCYSHNLPFISFSNYSVFNGDKEGFYNEKDETNPINEYGKLMLEQENEVLNSNPNVLMLRLPWVYSVFSPNSFIYGLINAIIENDSLSIIDDQFGSLLNVFDLSTYMPSIVEQFISNNRSGLYHLSSGEGVSKYSIGQKIMKVLERNFHEVVEMKSFNPISSSEMDDDFIQKNCCLDSSKFNNDFENIDLTNWSFSLHNAAQKIFKKIFNKIHK